MRFQSKSKHCEDVLQHHRLRQPLSRLLQRRSMKWLILSLTPVLLGQAAVPIPSPILDSINAGVHNVLKPELSDPRTTVNAVLEQFVGILPPVTVQALRSRMSLSPITPPNMATERPSRPAPACLGAHQSRRFNPAYRKCPGVYRAKLLWQYRHGN